MVAGAPVDLSQPIEQKHAEFFDRIKERGQICGLAHGVIPPTPKTWDLGASGSVTRFMTKDVRQLFLSYGARSELYLTRQDVLNLTMRLNRVDSQVIVDDVFMFYAKAFGADRAFCRDTRLGAWTYEVKRSVYSATKKEIFVEQLEWISNVYAWRKMQVSAKEIGERVEPVAERVEYFSDGVYIVLDSRPLTMAEAKEKTLAANLALYPEIAPIIPSLYELYREE